MKNYIPVELWRDTYTNPQMAKSFTFVEKVPLSKIKIDKSLFSFQNEVSSSRVEFMVKNFDIDFWMPIIINSDYFLFPDPYGIYLNFKIMRRLVVPHKKYLV